MKLCWIVPGGVDQSGTERVVPTLIWQIKRLAARHDLHIIALAQHAADTEYTLHGARVHSLAPRNVASTLIAIRRVLAEHGAFDLFHAFWVGTGAAAAVAVARLRRRPAVVTIFGGELASLPDIGYGGARTTLGRARVAAVLRTADAVTCESAFAAGLARARGIVATELPFGADREYFRPRLRQPDGPPWRLLHVASLNRVKDQETLLRALVRVHRHEPRTVLDIVGADTLDGAIQRRARDLGLGDIVRFHGVKPWTALPPLYEAAHLLVMSSRHEGAPLVALEAALCGVPAVATRVGYFADWESAGLARVVAPGDHAALADAVITLLGAPAVRADIAERARQFAAAHDADYTASRLEDLYGRLAMRGGA